MKVNEDDAWEAMDKGNYSEAKCIWEKLLESCGNDSEADKYKHGYGYALVGLKLWDEARSIYQELYDKTGNHVYIHQLGMVEREAGNYKDATVLFKKEWEMISDNDNLARAANLYEQGFIEHKCGSLDLSIKLAKKCLEFSLLTDDKIMYGCAHRLLGDIFLNCNPDDSREYYIKARFFFQEAGDSMACNELDQMLAKLKT